MNFEIVDNIFQILVLFCVMTASAVTACKKKSRDFLLLAGGYGCFMMGTLYYVLYLIIMGKVPQVFYVAEISWLAAYLFFLSLSLSRRNLRGRLPGAASVFGTLLILCLVMAFQIFGPSLFFSGCFGITVGTIVLRCMEVLRREREHHLLDGIMLLVAWLQVALYIVSEFIKDYTRFNLYFAVDITLTLTLAYLFLALRKEVERG